MGYAIDSRRGFRSREYEAGDIYEYMDNNASASVSFRVFLRVIAIVSRWNILCKRARRRPSSVQLLRIARNVLED